MKRFLGLIPLLFLLCSCSVDKSADTLSNNSTPNTLSQYMYVDLPQLQKENQRIYYVEWGKLTESSSVDTVYVLSDIQTDADIQTEVYMAAYVQNELITYPIGVFDKMVIQNGSLFLADIDNDEIDEIVIHFEISGNGETITQIYKIENQKINLFLDLSDFDTGYSSEFQAERKLLIENAKASYSYTLDISDMFTDNFFDETGIAVTNEAIMLSPFISCTVSDADTDGNCELLCEQNVTLDSAFIGKVKTVLQYNAAEHQFQIIDAKFEK